MRATGVRGTWPLFVVGWLVLGCDAGGSPASPTSVPSPTSLPSPTSRGDGPTEATAAPERSVCPSLLARKKGGAPASRFVDVGDPAEPRWVRADDPGVDGEGAYARAAVWRAEEGTLVELAATSAADDWTETVLYCFRGDGSLAQLVAELRTFNAEPVPVRRTRHIAFSRSREVTQRSERLYDLESDEPLTDASFMDREVPTYLTRAELPFAALLE